jgi:hypothetical protein
MSTSGNIYQNLLSQGTNNRTYGRAEGERTASAIGGLARDVGEVAFKRQPAPAVKSTTPQPSGAAPGPAAPAGTPAPPPQAGTPHAPPAPAGPGQLPFGTPGQLGMGDFRPGVRKPQTSLGGDFRTY